MTTSSLTTLDRPVVKPATAVRLRRKRSLTATTLFSYGEPMLWLTGGALALSLAMIVGLLILIFAQGIGTFWPVPLVEVHRKEGGVLLGEVTREETVSLEGKVIHRRMLRTGNFELTGEHFHWVVTDDIQSESRPPWALTIERRAWGRFYGMPKAFFLDGAAIAQTPASVMSQLHTHLSSIQKRLEQRQEMESVVIGRINAELEEMRLALRKVELASGLQSETYRALQNQLMEKEKNAAAEFERIQLQIQALQKENARYQLLVTTGDGQEKTLALEEIVRAYPANGLSFIDKASIYLSRWMEFLLDKPREANSEGGIFPAIFGTIAMTFIMSIFVVPFGVLAALYMREYATKGWMLSTVRIAVNNLAGVPSIVFGVFGLGFFCYILGGGIDSWLFAAKLPNPTYGKGGILWAALTLALLTLPVVIVATEEALAAVPNSMREGSYACGASKWQTIRHIILPRALPGIMTGVILSMARGAGEVAPLMLVGAVKLAPDLPIDGVLPFVHPQRSFMHLGFHIYDLGFQSQNSEAAKPMVFTTTLLLIATIAILNVLAIWIRGRLRKRFISGHF